MDLQMNGKTALVTGASAGIGKAIAFALAREGVDVAICARRKEPLEAAASQIARETNRKIVAIPADLIKPDDAAAFGRLTPRSGASIFWSTTPGRHPAEFSSS
jgi:3-oxoacyl-[acyl-carrier protein] reductase